ncbi:MAG: PIG-L family deacetylase [Oscillospiraceae bacterium]|nr:PIG-L family deacetylase [Oscillospiraceae bacterium]
MKVLAITCHPDDAEIYVGGTLCKYARRGDEVTVCHIANGSQGHAVILPDELRRLRIREAYEGGRLLGVKETICLDVNDLEVDSSDRGVVTALVEVIRHAQPDVVFTHSPNDYMKDHVETGKLAFDATFSASVPHYATAQYMEKQSFAMRQPVVGARIGEAPPFALGSQMPAKLVPLYYVDTPSGVGFEPDIYVDITDELETKLRAVACHETQVKWMREHDHVDFPEMVRTFSKNRGYQCGRPYAEGFTACRAYPRMPVAGLLP